MFALAPEVNLSSSVTSKWPHLSEKEVMDGIDKLKADPNLINQGSLGLCGEATFLHHVLQRSPFLFGTMARHLFEDGITCLGQLMIEPDTDLLEADYANIAATWTDTPPQADWMVLSALRDTENEYADFEGTPIENWSDGSALDERLGWYRRCHLYKTSYLYEETDLLSIQSKIVKKPSNHVSLRIDVSMIDPGSSGRHVISLESALVFDPINGTVTFDYWSWGQAVTTGYSLTIAAFQSKYLGAIVAEF